jgi:hypothetical protein
LEKEGRKGGKEGEKEEEWKEFFDVWKFLVSH